MNKDEQQKLAAYAKAMGHPVRVLILELLGLSGKCLTGDLSERLPVAASTASQHLTVLREAGLISGTIDGPRRCLCVNREALDEARELLTSLRTCCETGA